jgi:hypothetical protein
MVYEHLLEYFILDGPSSGFLKLFEIVVVVARGDILRLVALVLGVSKLLVWQRILMVFILLSQVKCFFDILIVPLPYNFAGHFKSTYPPINLEY